MKLQTILSSSLIACSGFTAVCVRSQSVVEEIGDKEILRNSNLPYDKNACQPGSHDVSNPSPEPDARAPDHFYFRMPTTVANNNGDDGDAVIVFEVNRAWAPIGVDRFYALASDNYYDCAAFFRVVPGFVVQWGIASDAEETAKWNTVIGDDPVLESNVAGTVSFATAGPGTRTTQIFVNTVDNARLDDMGFAPFARVVEGMDTVFASGSNLYRPNPVPDQGRLEDEGNAWILEDYPAIDIVKGLPQQSGGATTEIKMTLDEDDEDVVIVDEVFEEPPPSEEAPAKETEPNGSAAEGQEDNGKVHTEEEKEGHKPQSTDEDISNLSSNNISSSAVGVFTSHRKCSAVILSSFAIAAAIL